MTARNTPFIVADRQEPQYIAGYHLESNNQRLEDAELVTIQGTNFYTVDETAKLLGVTKKTLYNWKSKLESSGAKQLPVLHPVTAPNGRKYFREEEIIAVLSQCWEIEVTPAALNNPENLVHA
jgi:transposase-like protein